MSNQSGGFPTELKLVAGTVFGYVNSNSNVTVSFKLDPSGRGVELLFF